MTKRKNFYFQKFIEQAKHLQSAAQIVADLFERFDTFLLPQSLENMAAVKKEACALKSEILATLSKEFLPPIEREDVAALTRILCDVTASAERLLQSVYMFNLTCIDLFMKEFSSIFLNCACELLSCTVELENFAKSQNVSDGIDKISALVNESNSAFVKANRQLFTTSCDTKEMLIKSQIYKTANDSCLIFKAVSDITEDIILKNT